MPDTIAFWQKFFGEYHWKQVIYSKPVTQKTLQMTWRKLIARISAGKHKLNNRDSSKKIAKGGFIQIIPKSASGGLERPFSGKGWLLEERP